MTLTEQTTIQQDNNLYPILDNLCFLSKNLYNASLYAIRQYYFTNHEFYDAYKVINEFTQTNNVDYRALPAKVSQQTILLVGQNFNSFFSSIKAGIKTAKIPHYLDKQGRQVVTYSKQAVGIRYLKKEHCYTLSGVRDENNNLIKFKTKVDNIQFVRIIPKGNHIVIEVGYEKQEKSIELNNHIAAIDLGVNNLATVTTNINAPFIISGKPLKYINHEYNKRIGEIQKCNYYCNNITKKWTKSMYKEVDKRNNRIKDFLHKASRSIVNYLVSNDITTLVIGKNNGWKQNTKLGKRNNQNFVQIPFNQFISMLEYKCELEGIQVIVINESYTSKCSFIDNEEMIHHDVYCGKRKTRDLFVTKNNICINADVNGSYNIMRKFCETPINKYNACHNSRKITIDLNSKNLIKF